MFLRELLPQEIGYVPVNLWGQGDIKVWSRVLSK
ncbi:MAG: hypothetical protein ETSY2_47895 [Candidatus Entotheonella gemina]|uniref:Uncharacterized protein n=1 Tax=Candidatus Entotheonella gemina TaxID=1429439 RepID=W4LCF1_9BACT|nr:MAG: hypothetical protein ETSY2_47895 [Candidatus Entotheonella gemina]